LIAVLVSEKGFATIVEAYQRQFLKALGQGDHWKKRNALVATAEKNDQERANARHSVSCSSNQLQIWPVKAFGALALHFWPDLLLGRFPAFCSYHVTTSFDVDHLKTWRELVSAFHEDQLLDF
jgi:hypothetical protein